MQDQFGQRFAVALARLQEQRGAGGAIKK